MLTSVALLVALAVPPTHVRQEVVDGQRQGLIDADTYNYLTTRLRLVKRGTALEELKIEVVDQVHLGRLSPEGLKFLKTFMTLCDRAIELQASLSADLARVDEKGKAQALGDLVKLGVTGFDLYTTGGSLTGALSAVPLLGGVGSADIERHRLEATSVASLGSEVSEMEFDLAVWRSQLETSYPLPANSFIGPADYDGFLSAAGQESEDQRIAGVVAALERSPRMQPAALHLAEYWHGTGNREALLRSADVAIATSPQILRRDASRGRALLLKALAGIEAQEYEAALASSLAGLEDDPSSPGLLHVRTFALMNLGRFEDALPVLEKLVLLVPGNGQVLYNLACCRSVLGEVNGALTALEESLAGGFWDIDHLRSDPDLENLRAERTEQLSDLTAMRLRPEMDWNAINHDVLYIINESRFTLHALEVTIKVQVRPRGQEPRELEEAVTIQELAPGAALQLRRLISTTQQSFGGLQLSANGSQGQFEQSFSKDEVGVWKGGTGSRR